MTDPLIIALSVCLSVVFLMAIVLGLGVLATVGASAAVLLAFALGVAQP